MEKILGVLGISILATIISAILTLILIRVIKRIKEKYFENRKK